MTRSAASPLRIPRNTKTLREMALETMREAILAGYFQPGERLVERQLCEQLEVSRSIVREVLRHLETEGLVDTRGLQGPVVATVDAGQAAQIYEIRGLLESEAARACALKADAAAIAELGRMIDIIDAAFRVGSPRELLRATTDFYEKLFIAAGKEVAWDVVRSLNARISHLRGMTTAAEGRHEAAIGEMRRLHDAIRRHDGDAAYAASRDHVATVARLADAILGDF